MIYFDGVVLNECDSVEACGKTEYAVNYVFEFEVGAHGLFVEGGFLGFELVRVVGVVPGLYGDGMTFELRCELCELGHLGLKSGPVGVAEPVEQVVDGFRSLCHGAAEGVCGVGGAAEQTGYLHAYLADAADVVEVGVFAFGVAARVETVHALAQVGTRRVLHEGRVDGSVEGEEVFAVAAFGPGGFCGCRHGAFGESGQVVGLEVDFVGVHLLEDVLAECGGEGRQLGR